MLREAGRRNVPQIYRYDYQRKQYVGPPRINPLFVDDHWVHYAAKRLAALERIGELSANNKNVQLALEVMIHHHARQGRLLEAIETLNRLVEENPREPFWRIIQARVYHGRNSSNTRALYDQLNADMDVDHPNARVRQRWTWFAANVKSAGREELPHAVLPPPKGSPLLLMEPDDPDREWAAVANRSAREIPKEIDRLAALATVGDGVPWNDMNGLTDPVRALDLHLLSQPKADLEPLRKVQAEDFAQEELPSSASHAEVLARYRRHAWAAAAQQRLLAWANRMLWTGRAQSALRSFRDVSEHASDASLRDAAQIGCWTAQAQIGRIETPEEMLGDVDPNRVFDWLGKPT
ncbi:MAG: hypothetical protein N2C14_11810, partial [Planctomycetales bacterium]